MPIDLTPLVQYGALGTIVIVLLIREFTRAAQDRKDRVADRLRNQKLDDYIKSTLRETLDRTSASNDRLTRVLDSLVKSLKGRPCLVQHSDDDDIAVAAREMHYQKRMMTPPEGIQPPEDL